MPFKQFQAALLTNCRFARSNVRRRDNVDLFGIGLVVLALQMQAGGFNLANADELVEPLYPGRYVANCKPAARFWLYLRHRFHQPRFDAFAGQQRNSKRSHPRRRTSATRRVDAFDLCSDHPTGRGSLRRVSAHGELRVNSS